MKALNLFISRPLIYRSELLKPSVLFAQRGANPLPRGAECFVNFARIFAASLGQRRTPATTTTNNRRDLLDQVAGMNSLAEIVGHGSDKLRFILIDHG